jgi:hypothetical protein
MYLAWYPNDGWYQERHTEKSPSIIAKSPMYLFGDLTAASAQTEEPSLFPKLSPTSAPDG